MANTIRLLPAPRNLWMRRAAPRDAARLSDIAAAMETIAPLHLAEAWDNVGLLSGHRTSLVQRVLLTIDITPAVHDEAIAKDIDLIISYHPPIFKPLKHLRIDGDEPPALAVALASFGVWVYSPHTALDTAPDGTNDVLAEALGARVTGSFSHYPARGTYLKLVTFVPESDLEKVADAVFAAGAGHIGTKAKYTRCSFRTGGTGTFMGNRESAAPAVGAAGVYEHVPEIRFETILPAPLAGDVIDALRRAHPYEEPAFDLLRMETPPEQVGLGRYAEFDQPIALGELLARGKKVLKVSQAQCLGKTRRKIRTLALVAGAAGRLGLDQAHQPYDCLITGELKHHEQIAYAAGGKACLMFGHASTERPVLASLAKRLKKQLPTLEYLLSRADATS